MSSEQQRPSEQEHIDASAAAWFAQRDAGLNPSEQKQFAAWLAADSRHRAAWARLDRTWQTLLRLRDFRPAAQQHPDSDLLVHAPSARSRKLPAWLGVAAAVVVCCSVLLWRNAPRAPASTPGQTYATTQGGYQRVNLPDGSSVELNAGTEVDVQFAADERRIELRRGEAYFTVAKDETRPFRVRVDGMTVQAVGTAFAVRRMDQELEVLVTAGTVKLQTSHSPAASEAGSPSLGAGWRAVVAKDGQSPARLEQTSTELMRKLLSWQSSRLFFVEMPLEEVVQQFNQRNAVQLHITDAELGRLHIGGSFEAQNVEAFVRLLTSSGEIVAIEEAGRRIELRRAGP